MSSIDITEAMIIAARNAAPLALTREDTRRILAAGLSQMNTTERGAAFPLWIDTTLAVKRGRFLGVTERPCYFRIQTEDGRELTVHGNDIKTSKGPKSCKHS